MCGFLSIFGPQGRDVMQDVLDGLLAIQHRGQDAAGMVTYDTRFHAKKGLGLVREVFEEKHLGRLKGNLAVGHVRYPTVGVGTDMDVQPFWLDFPLGIAMAHNGNVTNFHELKRAYFPEREIHLTSDCDLEAVLYVFAHALLGKNPRELRAEDIWTAVGEVFRTVKGSYSVVGIIAGKGMFAFRDPYGIKPIIMGERREGTETTFAVASESVVLDVTGFGNLRDLKAGEALWIDKERKVHFMPVARSPHRPCIFEYVYFARPDSVLDGISVYKTRLRLGERLAEAWKKTGLTADVVIPVPESARTAGQSMAQSLGIPCREGLVKNRYVGRTFIMPSDTERKRSIRMKLNPIRLEFEGKRVLILDDSIVRGNTSRQLVKIARECGAAKVYLASYSPPLLFPCVYGIDMSTKREFVARGQTREQLEKDLGCDYLLYQELADLVDCARAGNPTIEKFCTACFDGHYPTGDVTDAMLDEIANERENAKA